MHGLIGAIRLGDGPPFLMLVAGHGTRYDVKMERKLLLSRQLAELKLELEKVRVKPKPNPSDIRDPYSNELVDSPH